VGVKAPEKKIAIKYVVKSCLNKLENIGYTLPTLSSMTIQAIDVGSFMMLRASVQGLLEPTETMWCFALLAGYPPTSAWLFLFRSLLLPDTLLFQS
jgi:hypothetical protein